MKKRYIYLVLGSVLLLGYQQAGAQLVVNGTNYSNYGYVSNYDTYTIITGVSGSSYDAAFGAIFDHNESDVNTLRVDNVYNANGTGGSTDNFNGPLGVTGVQGISGSVAPNFSTLVLKNGATSLFNITNTAGANVFVTADFQNGITTTVRTATVAGALRFEVGATYTGGISDTQHVNGYVGKIGNEAFTFPVGSGTDSRTLTIAAPASATAQLTTAYDTTSVENPGAVLGPIQSVFPFGSWDWIASATTDDDGLAVAVSIPDVTGFALTANLRLVGWNGAQWIDMSGVPTASGNVENSTLSGTIPAGVSITQIGIGSVEFPLPVTLIAFGVRAEGQMALLNWATTEETNSDRFEIQQSSDVQNWQTIGNVKSHGESNTLQSYDFVHLQPADGTNYYRLKMWDYDGIFAYSRIATVTFEIEDIVISPNPVVDKLTLKVSDIGALERILIASASGKTMYDQLKQKDADLPRIIDVRGFPSGVYIIRLTKANGTIIANTIFKQ